MDHQVDQNSPDWHSLRLGIPTASQFGNIITPTGSRTTGDKRKNYMCKLICERIFGTSMGDDISELKWVKHGRQFEAQAAHVLSGMEGLDLGAGGFVTHLGCGCSPDRIVRAGGNRTGRGAVEIKCPSPWVHMSNILYGPGDQYYPQVMGQMLIGQFDYVHFFSYHPAMPPVQRIYEKNDKYLAALQRELKTFVDELEEETQRALDKGTYDPSRLT
jgi:hypothetical protein